MFGAPNDCSLESARVIGGSRAGLACVDELRERHNVDVVGKRVPLGARIRDQEFVEPEVRQRDTHRRREPRRGPPFALDADAAVAFEYRCPQDGVLIAGSQQLAVCRQRWKKTSTPEALSQA